MMACSPCGAVLRPEAGSSPCVEITRVARQAAVGGAQAAKRPEREGGSGEGIGGRRVSFPSSPPRRQARPQFQPFQLAEVRP